MCVPCLRTQVDISEGIPKQVTVHFCKQCERFVYAANNNLALTLTPKRQRSWMYICLSCRYLQPPTTWMQCALESRELLALCLKKIKSSMTKVTIRNFFYNTDCLAECSYCVFCFTFFFSILFLPLLLLNSHGFMLYKACYKCANDYKHDWSPCLGLWFKHKITSNFVYSVKVPMLSLSLSLRRCASLMLASCGQSHTLKGLRSKWPFRKR